MTYEGQPIGISSQPIYDGARWLLRHDLADKHDQIETRRGSVVCLRAGVGVAAGLMLVERNRTGLRTEPYNAYEAPEERLAKMSVAGYEMLQAAE